MATNIITCSIPVELARFLEENEELSPSKVLQARLFQIKNDEYGLQERLKANILRVENATRRLNNVLRFCESINIAIPANVLE